MVGLFNEMGEATHFVVAIVFGSDFVILVRKLSPRRLVGNCLKFSWEFLRVPGDCMPVAEQNISAGAGVGPVSLEKRNRNFLAHCVCMAEVLFAMVLSVAMSCIKFKRSAWSCSDRAGLNLSSLSFISFYIKDDLSCPTDSFMADCAACMSRSYYMVPYPYIKVFPLKGIMPFKPGI